MAPRRLMIIIITIISLLFILFFHSYGKSWNYNTLQMHYMSEVNKALSVLTNQTKQLENTILEVIKNTTQGITRISNNKLKSKKINKHVVIDNVIIDDKIEYEFIVVVSSNLPHLERRQIIRQKWGNKEMWKKNEKQWKIFFVVGKSKNQILTGKVMKEVEIYNDVIMIDIVEDFYALSKKVMTGIQWAHTNFNYKFILKCDDDIFVQIDRLMNLVGCSSDHGYIGQPMVGQPVERKGRYALTKEEHHNDTFDPYCSGGAFLLSFEAVNRIIPLFNWNKPLKIDDAYIGQLVHKTGITLTKQEGFFMWNRWCEYNKELIISHPVKVRKCMDFMVAKSLHENGKLLDATIINKTNPYTDEERAKL